MQLIKTLLKIKDWITASTLAGELGISVRTIKNYVAQLNQLYPNLILSSKNGYMIDSHAASGALNALRDSQPRLPQTNKERGTFVIIQLLRSPLPLSLYDLCDSLYISMSTLRMVLNRIRRQFSQYDLELSVSGDQAKILGSEQNRRRMLSSIIFAESNSTFFDLNVIQDAFDAIDTERALNIMSEILLEGHYYVNDFSAFNILLHIIICIDRSMHRNIESASIEDDAPHNLPAFIPAHIYHMAQTLAARLEEVFAVSFDADDIFEFALLFYTRATSLTMDVIDESNLEDYIGRECMLLVNDMMTHLQCDYGVELTNAETRIRFALHLRSLLIRSRTNNFNRNPLTESIKTSCPLIYDVAVRLSSLIAERTATPMTDDEIAYIAFHIGNAIETQRAYESRISVILNCPTYYNMNHDLHKKLMERFQNDIIITNITISESQLQDFSSADLVLSTVPFKYGLDTPNIQIQPFLTMTDTAMIEHAVSRIKEEKKKYVFFNEMRKIMLPDFYEHLNRSMTKRELIHYMCERLFQAGFASSGFEEAVWEREQLSSTAFTNFAIPHTMHMREKKSCMYILINDTPVDWDETPVNLVIMLCFNASDRSIFNTVFEPLSISLLNRAVIRQILDTHSYEEFIAIIGNLDS